MRIGCVVAEQVENAPVLERRCAAAMLLQGRAAEGVEKDLQGGVGADLVQGLALVLEDLRPRQGFGLQHAAFGRAVHMFD